MQTYEPWAADGVPVVLLVKAASLAVIHRSLPDVDESRLQLGDCQALAGDDVSRRRGLTQVPRVIAARVRG